MAFSAMPIKDFWMISMSEEEPDKIAKMNSDRFIVVNANNSFEEIDRFVKSSLIKKLKI